LHDAEIKLSLISALSVRHPSVFLTQQTHDPSVARTQDVRTTDWLTNRSRVRYEYSTAINTDNERLVEEVKKRSILYEQTSNSYKEAKRKDAA
jgi:hypothetical protein